MTLITDALDRIARECGVAAPSSWVNATSNVHKEIRDDFMPQTIYDVLERVDVASPIAKQQIITGTGAQNYSLNSNFYRVQRDELAVYDTGLDRPSIPVGGDGEWTRLTDLGAAGSARYYRIKGYAGNYTIDLYNEPTSSDSITVSYIADVWKVNSVGAEGNTFGDAEDVLLLPRRIVETGTVWRFRERRGLPYQDKYAEYEALISRLSNDGRSRRSVNFGDVKRVRWQDLIPAFIPDS